MSRSLAALVLLTICASCAPAEDSAVTFAAVSKASLIAGQTIVNDQKVKDLEDWVGDANERRTVILDPLKTVPKEDASARLQAYFAFSAKPVMDRPGYFVSRTYLAGDTGRLEIKEVTLKQVERSWVLVLTVRGSGQAQMDLLYSRKLGFRQSWQSFPELDIQKPIPISYVSGHPIDVGNIKEPIRIELSDGWAEWKVSLSRAIIRQAQAVDDSLQILEKLQTRFESEQSADGKQVDAAWDQAVLDSKTVNVLIAELRAQADPFEIALEVGGNTVYGSSDFVPDIRQRIRVEDKQKSHAPLPAEIWIRSSKAR